jgi:hypothetical protein
MWMSQEAGAVSPDQFQEQVQRILDSPGFHGAEALRRLLQYLAGKSASGAVDLKEYTVAIEGVGKPPSYDPQKNSSVRIQAGRLRQKLAEYYTGAGKDDPILIDLAKGSFLLAARPRTPELAEGPPIHERKNLVTPDAGPSPAETTRLFSFNFFFGLLAGCLLFFAVWSVVHLASAKSHDPAPAVSPWSPALRALWAPFVQSKHPLIVSIEDPLFFEFQTNPSIFFRNRSMNAWGDWQRSSELRTIAMKHTTAAVQPSRYFTTFGEVEASLLLGRLLGPRVQILSLSRSSELTWNQLANNDVLFVGVQYSFFKQINDLPIAPQLTATNKGVTDSHPAPGHPAFYLDQFPPGGENTVYSLVSRLPGPSGLTEVESFTSNRSAGYVAAVRWFTDPDCAAPLVAKLRDAGGGRIPQYYQVLLKITSKDGVPTSVSYLLARPLS